jgi:hypothetical protein
VHAFPATFPAFVESSSPENSAHTPEPHGYCTVQVQANAFRSWQAFSAMQLNMRSHALRVAATSSHRRRLHHALYAWRFHHNRINSIRAHLQRVRLRTHLRQWQEVAHRSKSARQEADDLAACRLGCLLRKAFSGWSHETAFMAKVRRHVCSRAEMRKCHMKHLTFSGWATAAVHAADLGRRVLELAERRRKLTTFSAWAQKTAEAANKRERAEGLAEQRRAHMKCAALVGWAHAAAQAASLRGCANELQHQTRRQHSSRVVVVWKAKAMWHLGEAQRELAALQHWVHGVLARALTAWQEVLLARRMQEGIAEAAFARRGKQLLTRAFYQWRAHRNVLALQQIALQGVCASCRTLGRATLMQTTAMQGLNSVDIVQRTAVHYCTKGGLTV